MGRTCVELRFDKMHQFVFQIFQAVGYYYASPHIMATSIGRFKIRLSIHILSLYNHISSTFTKILFSGDINCVRK